MGSIFSHLTTPRGSQLADPPRLVMMTREALCKEIRDADQVVPSTIVLEYGESSFELVVGNLFKAYDEEKAVSWWVGDRLVGTASSDDSPIVPSPSLVFIRVGWRYPLGSLMMGEAA